MDLIKILYLKRKLHLIVIGLAFFIFAIRLYDGPLRTYDECYYAGQAREILVTGDPFTMHHALRNNYENDPVYLWSMAAMFKLFGASEFCARFPSAVYGALSVVTVFFTAKLIGSYIFALSAAVILATTWEFIRFARYAHLDVCLAFFTCAAVYFFFRHELTRVSKPSKSFYYAVLGGLCAGLAILSKNILGAFCVAAMAVYYILRRDFKALFSPGFIAAAFCAAALPGTWYIYQYLVNGPVFFYVHFGYILFRRAVDNPVEAAPAYQYLKIIALTYVPWLVLLVPGIYLIFKDYLAGAGLKKSPVRPVILYSAVFVTLYIGVMSLSSAKKGWYIMPVYPQFALICAFALERYFASGGTARAAARKNYLKFVSGAVLFMFFCAFALGVFPVKLYKTDNAEYKNEIAKFAAAFPLKPYDKTLRFQPVEFDCDYFDYQLPLLFYTGVIPEQSVKAAKLKISPADAGTIFFCERKKLGRILSESGTAGESLETLLSTDNFVIFRLKP
ncbi:MAG: Undecaprenyl phosphate-alpha-4-amino-4-deoxy-L-arabinose arabinosyl transferase [bacterium ADurb.Bin243]|nr:MAG: Undecaprenyl phosphate-alpha-4-amino-4-deoxy-L-arabinose arabinosyl transferase [bacterium ADurb.Bin243]HOD39908.1 phospholipid carrier-dependent glycosyltransferase [Candidatus Wallbacteria bacterium]